MREVAHKKIIQVLAVFLALIMLFPVVASAATSRYGQNASFEASGSPIVNKNFTSDQWNKWEIVAWGVFLSNFVVPMVDSYETAFSTGQGGSNGSGFKALDFSQASDANNNGILQNFLSFAIDQSKSEMTDIKVSYYYLDEKGNILADKDGTIQAVDGEKNPVSQPHMGQPDSGDGLSSATFRDILLGNLATIPDETKKSLRDSNAGGWLTGTEYGASGWIFDLFARNIFENKATVNGYNLALPPADSENNNIVAKLPVLWVQGADQTYVKVWDMLDPWDYQVAITMLAKEINSDAEIDAGLGQESMWENVVENIGSAFDEAYALKMDCFGNIVMITEASTSPIVVIPAAYNKHLTTEPMVNLVNSLFLTGPTSGVSGDTLIKQGKQSVDGGFGWLKTSDRDKHSGFDGGLYAFSWTGEGLPNNAVTLYFDSDSLYGRVYNDGTTGSISYGGHTMAAQTTARLGVLDLDLYGNRQYTRGQTSSYIVPKLELSGISTTAGIGKKDASDYKGKNDGLTSLMMMLSYGSSTVNLLPAAYNEAKVEYIKDITWKDAVTDVFSSPVVVPVAMKSGITKKKDVSWAYLARHFINYYGTDYYPKHKSVELARVSGADSYAKLMNAIMYNASGGAQGASAAVIEHAKQPAMSAYMKPDALAKTKQTSGLVWTTKDFIQDSVVDRSEGDTWDYLTKRWVKAYPTNKVLTEVGSYLGMRGDSEFSGAAAPYVYLSYLKIYGVDKVLSFTLNENPTKFNENLYDAESSLFTFNPGGKGGVKSDQEKQREVTTHMWNLLSPNDGNAYTRQLLSKIVGNFVYDQYNRAVFGGSLEYRSGGVQTVVTRSQTGFLRFPSLEDNMFTRWFYKEYAPVALWLLGVGLTFVLAFGLLRKRKVTWFFVSVILLVSCVVVIPFTNDMASRSMDGLVSNILKDKTTIWSLTEMLANSRAEQDFLSTGLTAEEAEIAASIMRDLSIVYTDRSLVLRQDISRKSITLGNYSELQQFASTRWALPSLVRQFSADNGSLDYLYVPLLDVADNAANAYWWYNPKDAWSAGGIAASDTQSHYAVGTQDGKAMAEYTQADLREFYPNYFSGNKDIPANIKEAVVRSYRSITSALEFEPVHNYVFMYMNNTYAGDSPKPLITAGSRPNILTSDMNNKTFWGDPKLLGDASIGGSGSFLSNISTSTLTQNGVALNRASASYDANLAHAELVQLLQKYSSYERDTMAAEFGYIWSTETMYPYFYALVKDTMSTLSSFDYQTKKAISAPADEDDSGVVEVVENSWDGTDTKRLGVIVGGLQGSIVTSGYYGETRSSFMHQGGLTETQLAIPDGNSTDYGLAFTGYGRDVLDLESVFKNVIPYMYQMTVVTGGLTGDHENDKGLFGDRTVSKSEYQMFEGLPHSWFYRSNWATKIVEAPAYNKKEIIGYIDAAGVKQKGTVTMTYLPDAYVAAGREMVFSEAQMHMMGLNEVDLTTLELKLIKLNKDVTLRWTALLNYYQTPGLTSEVMVRQMALDALTSFNSELTPPGLGNGAFSLYPSSVDLRSLSFDTIMRVILLNATKDSNYFSTDAMETVILEYDIGTGILLLITTWVCVYGVTLMRAFFLAFLFILGVYGVAKSVLAANNSKKATLLGYLTNIGILFVLSYLYYFIFNLLMTGANDAEYVGTGLSGVSAAPGWAILTILIASLAYMLGMFLMFRTVIRSVLSGTNDLGFGAYKDRAQAGYHKLSTSIREMRDSHTYEGLSSGAGNAGVSGVGSGTVSGGVSESRGGTARRRRSRDPNISGAGSGARALQASRSTARTRSMSALDDHELLDDTISRGGQTSTPQQPAMNLGDYSKSPGDKKKT